mmetsp:Transcript_11629/g.48913  ORF Transcript_11629/g.48913 Transcript_11629/m.48913 type:complete len:310 (-) Transcript_11629:295-1224(-)
MATAAAATATVAMSRVRGRSLRPWRTTTPTSTATPPLKRSGVATGATRASAQTALRVTRMASTTAMTTMTTTPTHQPMRRTATTTPRTSPPARRSCARSWRSSRRSARRSAQPQRLQRWTTLRSPSRSPRVEQMMPHSASSACAWCAGRSPTRKSSSRPSSRTRSARRLRPASTPSRSSAPPGGTTWSSRSSPPTSTPSRTATRRGWTSVGACSVANPRWPTWAFCGPRQARRANSFTPTAGLSSPRASTCRLRARARRARRSSICRRTPSTSSCRWWMLMAPTAPPSSSHAPIATATPRAPSSPRVWT